MRASGLKRVVLTLGGIGLVFYVGMFLKRGYEPTVKEMDSPRIIRMFSNMETNISNIFNALQAFEDKQKSMQKMLEEDRDRKAAEVKQLSVQKEPQQPEAKIQDQQEAPKEKKSNKLFPDSVLFKEWGGNLSEDDQREAQGLYEKYGYNVFLSDRLPLDRALPDTRDKRCLKKSYPKDLPSLGVVLIYLNEALSIIKRAMRSLIDRTPKNLLKEIILVDDNSSNGWLATYYSDCANTFVKEKLI